MLLPDRQRFAPQGMNLRKVTYTSAKRFKNMSKVEFGAEEPVAASFSPQLTCIACSTSPGLSLPFSFPFLIFMFPVRKH